MEQFGGTPLLVNRRQDQKLAAPLELFWAPKGSAAPRLRTTVLESCVRDLDCMRFGKQSEIIIFESLLTTFEARSVF